MFTTLRLIVNLPAEDVMREIVTRYWPGYENYYTDAKQETEAPYYWNRCHPNRQAAETDHAALVAAAIELGARQGQRRATLMGVEEIR